MSTFELKAIPTTYRGIEFRSRMEAQCAVLFDKLGWEFEYEKHSIILPSGTTFIPDFWFKKTGWLIECRGYDSDRGDRQIREMGAFVRDERYVDLGGDEYATDFAVIGPEKCYTFGASGKSQGFVLALSGRTGAWDLNHSYHDHTIAAVALGVREGRILLNGIPLDEAQQFHDTCDAIRPIREKFEAYVKEGVRKFIEASRKGAPNA